MARGKDDTTGVIIKKYANRRLYNTTSSAYVTLDDLCAMVKEGVEFTVQDARSGDDITRSVLTQIIFEQETKGANLLPVSFLRQLIGYYDDRLRALVPPYLEAAMDNFTDNQTQMRRSLEDRFGDFFPLRTIQELGEQNMAMFQQALAMFGPSHGAARNGGTPPQAENPAPDIDDLRAQMARMQAQLDALARKD